MAAADVVEVVTVEVAVASPPEVVAADSAEVAAVVTVAAVEVAVEVVVVVPPEAVALPVEEAVAEPELVEEPRSLLSREYNLPKLRSAPTDHFSSHRHAGVFVARGKEDLLVTKNLTPGESVYGEKRISVGASTAPKDGETEAPSSTEYRVWNPFRSKLAAGILGGVDNIYMGPGSKVLYLGAASGTSVSHVADIVGPEGTVFAVEFSHRSGRDLINMATHRTNVIPIVEDGMSLPTLLFSIVANMIHSSSPSEVPHARRHGRLHFRRRCPARSSPYRWSQRRTLPQGWRWYRHLHQGQLYRLYCCPRGRLRTGSHQAARDGHQAQGAAYS